MKPSLQVRLSQHLALTPQLQQSIRLLQLSTLELHQEVEQMLEQNPFLETEEEAAPAFEPLAERISSAEHAGERESRARGRDRRRRRRRRRGRPAIDGAAEFGATEREDWENGTERDDFDGIRETPGKTRTQNDGDDFERAGPRHAGDRACRTTCAASSRACGCRRRTRAAVQVLIESLDDDGYLADPLEEIAERLREGGLAFERDEAERADEDDQSTDPRPAALRPALAAEHGADRRRRARPGRVPDAAAARQAALRGAGDRDHRLQAPPACWRGAT